MNVSKKIFLSTFFFKKVKFFFISSFQRQLVRRDFLSWWRVRVFSRRFHPAFGWSNRHHASDET